MAAASATVATSLVSHAVVSRSLRASTFSSVKPVAGLPALRKVKVTCAVQDEQQTKKVEAVAVATSLAASAFAVAQPALALVDDRLSTEGTGLGLGISNPLLVWILLGVAALIWALFYGYASSLKEDDDSGLAL